MLYTNFRELLGTIQDMKDSYIGDTTDEALKNALADCVTSTSSNVAVPLWRVFFKACGALQKAMDGLMFDDYKKYLTSGQDSAIREVIVVTVAALKTHRVHMPALIDCSLTGHLPD